MNPTDFAPAAPPAKPSRFSIWPLVIVGLLAGHVALTLTMVKLATRDKSYVVDRDYYRRGLHWDEHKRLIAASLALGWSSSITAGPVDAAGSRSVTMLLLDRDGQPVRGATVEVTLMHPAAADERVKMSLVDQGEHYTGSGPMIRSGAWDVDVKVVRGDQLYIEDSKVIHVR